MVLQIRTISELSRLSSKILWRGSNLNTITIHYLYQWFEDRCVKFPTSPLLFLHLFCILEDLHSPYYSFFQTCLPIITMIVKGLGTCKKDPHIGIIKCNGLFLLQVLIIITFILFN